MHLSFLHFSLPFTCCFAASTLPLTSSTPAFIVMSFTRLFLAVLLVTSAAASPYTTSQKRAGKPPSLKTVMKANLAGGMTNIIASDRSRLKSHLSRNSVIPSRNSSKTKVLPRSDPAPINNNGVRLFLFVHYQYSDSQATSISSS